MLGSRSNLDYGRIVMMDSARTRRSGAFYVMNCRTMFGGIMIITYVHEYIVLPFF